MRVCANQACHGTLDHRRAGTKFCNATCRREAAVLSASDAPESFDSRRFWDGVSSIRRPSRARDIRRYAGSLA